MAEIFHGILSVNANTGNWLAFPTLTAGLSPRRRVLLRGDALVEFGYCTAGQSVQDSGVMCTGGAGSNFSFARDCGVLDYTRLTARAAGGGTASLYIYSLSNTDDGPRGM